MKNFPSIQTRHLRKMSLLQMWLSPLILLTAPITHARNVFTYDLNGNLVSQQTTTVLAAPTIVAGPRNALLTAEGTVRFSVAAAGGGPLSYQWRTDTTAVPGATKDTLTLTGLPLNQTSYPQITVVVSNSAGSVTSTAVTILPDSNGNGLPDAWEQQYFGGLTQTADADMDNDGVTNRDEWMDGTNPALNTSLRYTLSLAGVGGTVSHTPGALRYSAGTALTLQTASGVDNEFVGWFTSLGNSTNNPLQLTMNTHTSALAFHTSRLLRCWGDNTYGQAWAPPSLADSVMTAAGAYHGLVLRADGTVEGWGSNEQGQISIPATAYGVTGIAAGMQHSLAVRSDGAVLGWGNNLDGQVNIPSNLGQVVAVAAGGFHSLALRADGTVAAWGYAGDGQTDVPAGLSLVVSISAGWRHNLALRADGSVTGWGNNVDGQTTIPAGLGQVVAVAAGGFHSLALKADGTVAAWGYGGDGQTTVPAGLSQVVAISAGQRHSVALKADGTVVAWGLNTSGQNTPPAGMGSFVQISAGENFTAALTSIHPEQAPQVVGSRHQLALRGMPFHTQLAARNSPQTYAVTNLPPGLTLQTTTGVISGSPRQVGTYDMSITASNAAGSGQTFIRRITVSPVQPLFISLADAIVQPGAAWTHTPALNVAATGFSSSPLPSGLSLNPSTGVMSGTLAAPGIHHINLTATTVHGTAVQRLTVACATPGTNTPWHAQSGVTQDGNGALQSGGTADNFSSIMETSVTGAGELRFWWKVSSESSYDYLEFYVNGTLQPGRISGEVDWQLITHTLPTGTHTLRWRYVKDGSERNGADAGWVDGLAWTPAGGFASWNAFTPAQRADPLIGGPMADPDGDGHANLLEYAFNLNPWTATRTDVFSAGQMNSAGAAGRLCLTLSVPDPLPADVVYAIQAGDTPAASGWSTIATGTAAGGWSGPAQVTAGAPVAGYRLIEVQDTESKATKARRFMRLQIQTSP